MIPFKKMIALAPYKIFISACALVIFFFIFSVFAIVTNLRANGTHAPEISSPSFDSLSFNATLGKVLDIQGKTIFLETPAVDPVKQRLYEDKKEIRKLATDNKTQFFKQSFKLKEGKEKDGLESVLEKATLEDLKIGNSINTIYSGNLAEIKDFSPKTVIILPN